MSRELRQLIVTAVFAAVAGPCLFVGLTYFNPPGGSHTCLNSKIAACEITLERPGKAPRLVDTADREPRFVGPQRRRLADQVESGGGASGFGRRGPARAHAEIVDLLGHRGADLSAVVGGAADQRVRTDDATGHGQRQVVLTEVQADAIGLSALLAQSTAKRSTVALVFTK